MDSRNLLYKSDYFSGPTLPPSMMEESWYHVSPSATPSSNRHSSSPSSLPSLPMTSSSRRTIPISSLSQPPPVPALRSSHLISPSSPSSPSSLSSSSSSINSPSRFSSLLAPNDYPHSPSRSPSSSVPPLSPIQYQQGQPSPQALLRPSFENYYNTTCYMDCALLLLFLTSPGLIPLLKQPLHSSSLPAPVSSPSRGVTSAEAEYQIRQFILNTILPKVRGNVRISAEDVVTLLDLCKHCSDIWDHYHPVNGFPLQQDASEFMAWLMTTVLHAPPLKYRRKTFTGALPDPTDVGPVEETQFWPLPIDVPAPSSPPKSPRFSHSVYETLQRFRPLSSSIYGSFYGKPTVVNNVPSASSLEQLMFSSFFSNVATGLDRRVLADSRGSSSCEEKTDALLSYHLTEVPRYFPVVLKRFDVVDSFAQKRSIPVSFPSSLHLEMFLEEGDSFIDFLETEEEQTHVREEGWKLKGLICHKGESIQSGHFYAILRLEDKWVSFDDLRQPNTMYIDNPQLIFESLEIQKECFILLYECDVIPPPSAVIPSPTPVPAPVLQQAQALQAAAPVSSPRRIEPEVKIREPSPARVPVPAPVQQEKAMETLPLPPWASQLFVIVDNGPKLQLLPMLDGLDNRSDAVFCDLPLGSVRGDKTIVLQLQDAKSIKGMKIEAQILVPRFAHPPLSQYSTGRVEQQQQGFNSILLCTLSQAEPNFFNGKIQDRWQVEQQVSPKHAPQRFVTLVFTLKPLARC